VIDADGRYFIDEQQVVNTELDTLKSAIRKFLGEQTEIPVVIRADRRTPYESVVRAMDATSQLGLVHMSLATNQAESSGE
jgi:biopolymer transport protein ExbD